MLNRIEEVKKIARSMITASHYDNLNDDAFDSYIKEISQLFLQPLDDKKLREALKNLPKYLYCPKCMSWAWDYDGNRIARLE